MGLTETDRPQDAWNALGPLWCVPIVSGTAAVWCDAPHGTQIESIETSRGVSLPASRHRVHSPKGVVPFYVVSSDGLQDGHACRIVLTGADGDRVTQVREVRLAHWKVEFTPQILSFVISRILPKFDDSSDHTPLERYLSLVSSWRISVRPSADLGPRRAYTFPVSPGLCSETLSCFVVAGDKFRHETASSLSADDQTTLLLKSPRPVRGYADLGGDLIELDFSADTVTQDRSIAWIHSLPRPSLNRLFDVLSVAASEDDAPIPSFWATALRPDPIALAEPGAQVKIEGCFSVPGRLIMLLAVAGNLSLDGVSARVFGDGEDQPGASPVRRFDARQRTAGALPVTRTVVVFDFEGKAAPIACRLDGEVAGQSVGGWVPVHDGATGDSVECARTFWPHLRHDDEYVAEVVSPLAAAWAGRARCTHRPVRTPRCLSRESAVDLQIVCDRNLSSLHNTLIGLRSSQRSRQPVRISLHSFPDEEQAWAEITNWLNRYDLDGRIEVLSPHEPPAMAARLHCSDPDRATIALRAGFIPPHPGWATEVLQALEAHPRSALIGFAAHSTLRRVALPEGANGAADFAPSDDIGTEHLLDLLERGDIAAIAVSGRLLERIQVQQPACHTAMGAWVEWLCEARGRGMAIVPHPGLAVWDTNPQFPLDPFPLQVDGVSLRRRLEPSGGSAATITEPRRKDTTDRPLKNTAYRDERAGEWGNEKASQQF